MTRLPAERWLIHVGDAAITSSAYNDEVYDGSDNDKFDTTAKDGITKIDRGKDRRDLAERPEMTSPQ
jgi:hypothetical protein